MPMLTCSKDGKYLVPAWSVSILDNCNKEVYNTAKFNVRTSIIVKKKQVDHPLLGVGTRAD